MSADLEKLLAEATPGPWHVDPRQTRQHGDETLYDPPRIVWPEDEASGSICKCHLRGGGEPDAAKANARLIALAPDLARQVIALTAENAALRAKAEKLAGELDSMCCALHAEGDAHLVTKAKTARLMEAATPFSEMAGEMFARNWNKDSVAISFVTPDGPIRLTFAHFLALRQALTEWRKSYE